MGDIGIAILFLICIALCTTLLIIRCFLRDPENANMFLLAWAFLGAVQACVAALAIGLAFSYGLNGSILDVSYLISLVLVAVSCAAVGIWGHTR